MTLVTLSGTISATDLNTNFSDKVSTINTNNKRNKKDIMYELDILDPASGTAESLRILEFVPPQDLRVVVMGLTTYSPDGVVRVATLGLSAVDPSSGTAIPRYTDGANPNISVTSNAATEFSATRYNRASTKAQQLVLVEGVMYRLTISVDTASALDRAVGFVLCRARANRT